MIKLMNDKGENLFSITDNGELKFSEEEIKKQYNEVMNEYKKEKDGKANLKD